MSLVFSAITPHSPLLIPTIGKENTSRLAMTQKALEKLADELLASGVKTLLIISPHGHILDQAFSFNLLPNYQANFEEFGDFATKRQYKGNIGLAYKIKEQLETKANLQLVSLPDLDYAISVPLYLLTAKLPEIKIIPLYYSGLSSQAHFEFGQLIGQHLLDSPEPIGVIASGDLSHRLTKNAPAGYSPKGKRFDNRVIDLLIKNKTQDLINIDQDVKQQAAECGYNSILILMGILDGFKYEPQLMSYESPFGVGYLVMNFKL